MTTFPCISTVRSLTRLRPGEDVHGDSEPDDDRPDAEEDGGAEETGEAFSPLRDSTAPERRAEMDVRQVKAEVVAI
jgi:hypothetical protein